MRLLFVKDLPSGTMGNWISYGAMRPLTLTAVVLCAALAALSSQPIPPGTGAAGAWQKIQNSRPPRAYCTGTAHPDDEHGGLLAKLSRGDGARVIMLTLTRGESGDNAIGPQLFDALGLFAPMSSSPQTSTTASTSSTSRR